MLSVPVSVRAELSGSLYALAALVLTLGAGPAYAAKDTVPDWVRAAMAQPLDALPADSKAVVLLDDIVFTVGADGKAIEHRRHVVKILRPTGRDEGYVFVPFDADSKVLSLHVWSVGANGQEYVVKEKEIAEIGEPGAGNFYSDERAKVSDPPGRDPGGVVAYEYEQRKPYYRHEADWFFQDDIPRLKQSFQLELPPGYTSTAVWAHHAAVQPTDLEHDKQRWDLADTKAIDLDHVPLAPDLLGVSGRMTVHYGPAGQALGTWQQVGDAYDRIARDRMVADSGIAAKAAELTAGKTDFYDKTEAVAEFVQKDIRYFVVEKGIGGIQPHPAAEIFRNRFGDCKDKSTLLSAMLSSVGLRSVIVLVDTRRGFVDPEAPSMLGDHAIAAIEIPKGYESPKLRTVVTAKSGRRYLIVDPTWDKTAFGQLEHGLQGSYGVLIEGKDSELIQFPVLSPDFNTIRRSAVFDLQPDGSLKGAVTEQRFGDLSEYTRGLYTMADKRAQDNSLDRRLGRDFKSFTVSDVKVEDITALNKPVVTTYNLTAGGYGRTMGPLLMVRPRVMGSEGFELDRKKRHFPIDLEQTMRASDDFTIRLPTGYTLDELPEPVKVDVGFASYESATQLDGDSLHYTRTYTVRQVTVPADRYGDMQKLEAAIEGDEQNHAVFKKK